MTRQKREVHIGTSGWSIPRATAKNFPDDGSHLESYARILNFTEINTSFYRSHRPEVYARWAAQTPASFRFAVKVPRAITHDQRLRASRAPLAQFMSEVSGLGNRLGVLLVQLPPSLAFESRQVRTFFGLLARMHDGAVVCEPRHASWFEPAADRLLAKLRVGRVAADPARHPAGAVPVGWDSDDPMQGLTNLGRGQFSRSHAPISTPDPYAFTLKRTAVMACRL